jgi:hypothetical protein
MKLLRRSFELMGYREIVEVPVPGTGFMEPKMLGYQFRGLMGIR